MAKILVHTRPNTDKHFLLNFGITLLHYKTGKKKEVVLHDKYQEWISKNIFSETQSPSEQTSGTQPTTEKDEKSKTGFATSPFELLQPKATQGN